MTTTKHSDLRYAIRHRYELNPMVKIWSYFMRRGSDGSLQWQESFKRRKTPKLYRSLSTAWNAVRDYMPDAADRDEYGVEVCRWDINTNEAFALHEGDAKVTN